jgi:hypothetical protein
MDGGEGGALIRFERFAHPCRPWAKSVERYEEREAEKEDGQRDEEV